MFSQTIPTLSSNEKKLVLQYQLKHGQNFVLARKINGGDSIRRSAAAAAILRPQRITRAKFVLTCWHDTLWHEFLLKFHKHDVLEDPEGSSPLLAKAAQPPLVHFPVRIPSAASSRTACRWCSSGYFWRCRSPLFSAFWLWTGHSGRLRRLQYPELTVFDELSTLMGDNTMSVSAQPYQCLWRRRNHVLPDEHVGHAKNEKHYSWVF